MNALPWILFTLVSLTRVDDSKALPHLKDLSFLVGEWAGTLEYLDYQDNTKRRRLAATLLCKPTAEGWQYVFSYVEPDGRKVPGDPTLATVAKEGRWLKLDKEVWQVERVVVDAARDKFELVVGRDGTDNRKPARLTRTYSRDGSALTIRTEVQPDAKQPRFVRNEYTLKRQGGVGRSNEGS